MSLKRLIAIQLAGLSLMGSFGASYALSEKKADKKEPADIAGIQAQTSDPKPEPAKDSDIAKTPTTDLAQPGKQLLSDISKGFSVIAEPAIKAVVNVSTTQVVDTLPDKEQFRFPPGSPFEDFFREFFDQMERPRKVQAVGSGFIIKSDDTSALVVTNNHVVAEAKKISIFLHDGTELEAKLHAADDRTDIAVLKVSTEKLPKDRRKLPALEWGDSNQAKVGDWVLAVGNPFSLGSTVTSGIISNRAREIFSRARTRVSEFVDDFIQHDAAINLGNSGGPILNLDGKVIGINTAIFSPSGGHVGIGFAVPSNLAEKTVRQLIEFGRTKRGWLGVRIQHVTEDIAESLGLEKPRGAIVGFVTQDGPAAKAGLEPGDVILEFDGKEINDKARLTRLVADTPVGKEAKIKVFRKSKDGKSKDVTLSLTVGEYEESEKPTEKATPSKMKKSEEGVSEVLGMKLSAFTPKIKERFGLSKDTKGIVVVDLKRDSLAFENGLRPSDVIVQAQHKDVSTPSDFATIVNEEKKNGRKNILLLVTRGGEPRFVPLRIEEEKEGETTLKDEPKLPSKDSSSSSQFPDPKEKEKKAE